MKIYRVAATQYDNLQEGTVVRSDLYKREGDITLKERDAQSDGFGGEVVRYRAFFANTGRMSNLDARDITSIV